MKKFAMLMAVVMLAVFSAGVIVAADAPGKVTLKYFDKKQVNFDHKEHSARVTPCAKCHHKDGAGKEQKCSVCHVVGKAEGKKLDLKDAFHKTCRDCHKEDKKKVKGVCKECHRS